MSRRRASSSIVLLIVAGLLAAPAVAAPPVGSSGSGTYALLGTTPTTFEYGAVAQPNGGAGGHLFVSTVFQGFAIEFEGDVTCVTVDPANHRAWIGGVITANRSAHPRSRRRERRSGTTSGSALSTTARAPPPRPIGQRSSGSRATWTSRHRRPIARCSRGHRTTPGRGK